MKKQISGCHRLGMVGGAGRRGRGRLGKSSWCGNNCDLDCGGSYTNTRNKRPRKHTRLTSVDFLIFKLCHYVRCTH